MDSGAKGPELNALSSSQGLSDLCHLWTTIRYQDPRWIGCFQVLKGITKTRDLVHKGSLVWVAIAIAIYSKNL